MLKGRRKSGVLADSDPLLFGQGELAELMRAFDWNATALGPPQGWPQGLKTAVGIMLTSQQPIWIGWGPELTYLYNDPYKSIIGGKHPWALGRPTSVVWREIWDEIGPMLERAMGRQEGTYVESQLLIMERNGYPEETYYTFSYSPIPNDNGEAGGIFCANTDDTQRVIGERQLALLRDLAASTADARTRNEACAQAARALAAASRDLPFALIYVLEGDGRGASLAGLAGIEADHPAAVHNLAADSEHPWPIKQTLHGQTLQVVDDLGEFSAAFPTGAWQVPPRKAVVIPIPASGGSGHAGCLIVGLNPFRLFDAGYQDFLSLAAGQIGAAIANAQAYEQERRRAEALAEIDRAKTVFFSNVSHEFRTPLTLMLGPLEEVLAKPEPSVLPENRALVSLAHRSGIRLLKLVNTMLDFSRIEAGKQTATFEPIDLAAFTTDLASGFRSAIERAGLKLRIDFPPLAGPVHVDREMWEKIVLNLLSNALKFTFEGEIALIGRGTADGKSVEITFRDTGTGIPAYEIPHVFERFHRIENARGRSVEGSGIGLALVNELVKLHAGTIRVASEAGKGSEFVVTLRLGSAHLPADSVTEPRADAPSPLRTQAYVQEATGWLGGTDAVDPGAAIVPVSSAETGMSATTGRGQHILVADDNPDMLEYLERLLRATGYRVATARDGEAALRVARATKPQLILTDVMMPELGGFGLLSKIREDEALRDTPVVLLSARAGEEAKVEGLRAGADDYLTKPFSARELLARLESNLRLAQSRRENARMLRQEAEILQAVNAVGSAIAAELDLERAVQLVTDEATRLSGAQFGSFFYNVKDDAGESYTLYTLSGASREAFAGFPMPRNTAVFGPTFRGEGIVRSPDITKDPRYGQSAPHHGMPKGHLPVRSYLAVPVVSADGEVLGGLFFGHPEPDVFDMRAERVVAAIALHAAIAIEKARLYKAALAEIERRKQVEQALRETELGLERMVLERTSELAAANANLIEEAERREKLESQFQHLVEGVVDYALYMISPEGIVTNWNAGAERIKGYAASEIVGRHFQQFYPEEDRLAGVPKRALETAERTGKFEAEGWRVRKDGSRFFANVVINPIRDRDGHLLGFAKITRDITERREAQQALIRTQEQLMQAQKMEGIGQLTGGVAHDFNNLLTIIIGNLEAIQRYSRDGKLDAVKIDRSMELAMRGARRAEALTQRLLAFSRQQPLDPKPVELGRLVNGLSDLLRRTIGETIAVETVLSGGVWRTFVDPNQLEVAIINLAVNARDAMPQGGKLTLETANVYLDEHYTVDNAEVTPGQYVMLAVSDTGIGMTREVLTRAFEPFFTTKDVGHGTGLGLSQVYGFVKQSGGHVKIYSEPGAGTSVKLYLPRLHAEDVVEPEPEVIQPPSSVGGETILVVEDDDDVRAYSTETLRELGYRVFEANNGAAALQVLDQHPDIQVLFTDIGLPGGMNGRQLSEAARRKRPDLKVLFTTGYARNAIVHDGRLDPGIELVTKPFSQVAVAAKLRDILDARSGPLRILVVEDEILLQMLAIDMLEDAGFKVDTAGSATEAINKLRLIPGGVDAAIVDIGLPDRSGDMLLKELRAIYPSLPVVVATGHDRSALQARFKDESRVAIVGKPYLAADLLEALQQVGVSRPAAAAGRRS